MRLLFAAASLGSLVPAHSQHVEHSLGFCRTSSDCCVISDGGCGHWRQDSDTADFEGLAAFGSVDLPAFLEPQPF